MLGYKEWACGAWLRHCEEVAEDEEPEDDGAAADAPLPMMVSAFAN
jgi:hypothetical protein